ncbi:MAG: ammonium transporter [Rhodothermaceae bacterium]|nr:ammonium transporter [Rhodothermaceae bacterium]
MVPETQFVLNSFAFLIFGALVMWMAAGFTMLESGSVRTKNASVICLKNIGLYSIAGLAYYIIGYNLMYTDVSGFIGSFKLFFNASPEEIALLGGDTGVTQSVVDSGFSQMSGWFFQMVFVATAASIVSGALAERIRLWAFFTFVLALTALIYPIVGAWTWGEGWLFEMGFSDFAGSTIVHGTGGWAALAGAIILGPRLGKFKKDGTVKNTPPSSVPITTLGVFILWLGWFGFNGGSQLALGGALDVTAMAGIFVNTNLAGAAGALAAITVSRMILGRFDLFAVLNGALAGLVAVTAAPTMNHHGIAILIGFVGGVVCLLAIKLLDVLKIDDVVGAVPVHLFAGIWGTIAVAFTVDGTSFGIQLLGVLAIGVFVFGVSLGLWKLIDILIGTRVSKSVERLGQDVAELGVEAYPEFVLMPEDYDDED